jgi:hypothetical protein
MPYRTVVMGFLINSSTSWRQAIFAQNGRVALAGEGLLWGDGGTYEYRAYSREGELQRVVRSGVVPRPVTQADIDRHLRQSLDQYGAPRFADMPRSRIRSARRGLTLAYEQHPFRPTMPTYARLMGEEDGTVWVERYQPPATERPQWWARFDAEGHLTGTLSIPDSVTVMRFTRGHVILREPVGELGFVALRVHAIEPVEECHCLAKDCSRAILSARRGPLGSRLGSGCLDPPSGAS